MLLTTTPEIAGRTVDAYLGIATGEVIVGANILRDLFSSITDIVGGRASSYEAILKKARLRALDELSEEARDLGANAVLGVDIDYEVLGSDGSMLMVSATGTAVRLA